MDYRVNWNVHHIIRDFVQNFYDSIGCEQFADEFQYEWEIEKDRMLHIKMRTFGHSFSYEWLTYIGGSTKTGKDGYAGKYGEGFKIALLSLVKLGGDAVMSSGKWELHPCEYTEKIDGQEIRMFGYRMRERKDDGFTTLELYGIPASDENIRIVKEIPIRNKIGLKVVNDIKGINLRNPLFDKNAFPKAMAVYMHELLHQFGGDASRQFRTAILAMNYRIMEQSKILERYEKEWRECEA